MNRVDDAEWARYKGLAVPEGAEGPRREGRGPAAPQELTRQSWSDKIIISQDMQVGVVAVGGALVVGLVMQALAIVDIKCVSLGPEDAILWLRLCCLSGSHVEVVI